MMDVPTVSVGSEDISADPIEEVLIDKGKLSWKKLRQKEAKSKLDDSIERCNFIIPKKNRKCRMLVKQGQLFCGEHLIHDSNNKERIPCPNDAGHTVLKSELEKHLRNRCNSRLQADPWIVENLNAIKSETKFTDKIDRRPTEEELSSVLSRLEASLPTATRVDQKEIPQIMNFLSQNVDLGDVSRKHLIQISSIIGHMGSAELLQDDDKCSVVEFGAGKAQLAYWMAKAAAKAHYLLMDRSGARNKMDNQAIKENPSLNMKRLRCSIEHLDLSKVPHIKNVGSVTTVCKHFCGSATDAGIRCMVNGIKRGFNMHGMVLVPCCHHKMRYPEYTGHKYLESIGFKGEGDFAALRHISTWSVCGMDKVEKPDLFTEDPLAEYLEGSQNYKNSEILLPGDENTVQKEFKDDEVGIKRRKKDISDTTQDKRLWKEKMGRRAKMLFEIGRVEHLKALGYQVELIEYVPHAITPENLLILGTRSLS